MSADLVDTSNEADDFLTLYKVQICTGSISFLASLAMATSIQFSKRKLSTPYRRLVYGLCVADIIQSISIITGPFAPPAETPHGFWARGNIATCNVNGFMFSVGFTAVPMYILAMGVYYLCKLKRRMRDRDFAIKIEVWIHGFIILWHLVTNITLVATNHFNPGRDGGGCFVNYYPYRCNVMPEVGECKRGEYTDLMSTIFLFGPCASCFLGICYCMARLVQHAFFLLILSPSRKERSVHDGGEVDERQRVQSAHDEIESLGDVGEIHQESIIFHDIVTTVDSGGSKEEPSNVPQDDRPSHTNRPLEADEMDDAKNRAATLQELSILYKKEMLTNAISFIGVFFIVYLVPLLLWVHNITDSKVSFNMLILSSLLYPLGGLFNILVHTRSNIAALRRREGDPRRSWLCAFFAVLLAGGDTPPPRKDSISPSNDASSSSPRSSIKFGIANSR
mmetsp:Transcript_16197/g.30622  ORF Transcript_16197/g.30622 Transcript_16197/m.30622 type:complete len:450 (+) Transcript_16197:57-1406(+)